MIETTSVAFAKASRGVWFLKDRTSDEEQHLSSFSKAIDKK